MTLVAQAPAFTLYVIHTQGLVARAPGMQSAVQAIGGAAEAAGFAFHSVLITAPDAPAISERIKEYEKDGATPIDYAPTGVAALDHPSNLHVLSLQELSNLEKHREAWRRIAAGDERGRYAVIEDDIILLPDFATGFAEYMKKEQACGLFFWGIGPAAGVLPSKEAYVVQPPVAQQLLAESTPIKFGPRLYLSWALLRHPGWSAAAPAARWTADGSKLGVFPSACRANNPLIFNKEYMDVLTLLPSIGEPAVAEAIVKERLPALMRIRAPDALYLAGVVLEKLGNHEEARDLYVEAIAEMGRQGGILTTTSDLMTSTMKVHRHLQGPALAEARASPSKYDNVPLL